MYLFRKITAVFVAVCLIATENLSYAAPVTSNVGARSPRSEAKGGPPVANLAKGGETPPLQIPPELGALEESHAGPNGHTILYIQDAHDSLEAQENVAKLVEYFTARHGVKTVFEEGYEGPVPTEEYFGFIQDPVLKEKLSYFLMDQLRLGGAEYAHINRRNAKRKGHSAEEPLTPPLSPQGRGKGEGQDRSALGAMRSADFELLGADNIKAHLANIEAYQKAAQYQEAVAKDLTAIQQEIKNLRALSSPHALGGDPRLQHSGMTFKKIFEYDQKLKLLARLNRLEMTAEEYEVVREMLKGSDPNTNGVRPHQAFDTESLAQFIVDQTGRSVVFSKAWEKAIRNAVDFYEKAGERDRAIEKAISNVGATFMAPSDSKGVMNHAPTADRNSPAIPHTCAGCASAMTALPRNDVSVIVFGGFHKEAIKKILKRHGYSYHIITPRITSFPPRHQEYYKRLMTVGYHPFEAGMIREAMTVGARPASPAGGHAVPLHITNATAPPRAFLAYPQSEIRRLARIAAPLRGLRQEDFNLALEKRAAMKREGRWEKGKGKAADIFRRASPFGLRAGTEGAEPRSEARRFEYTEKFPSLQSLEVSRRLVKALEELPLDHAVNVRIHNRLAGKGVVELQITTVTTFFKEKPSIPAWHIAVVREPEDRRPSFYMGYVSVGILDETRTLEIMDFLPYASLQRTLYPPYVFSKEDQALAAKYSRLKYPEIMLWLLRDLALAKGYALQVSHGTESAAAAHLYMKVFADAIAFQGSSNFVKLTDEIQTDAGPVKIKDAFYDLRVVGETRLIGIGDRKTILWDSRKLWEGRFRLDYQGKTADTGLSIYGEIEDFSTGLPQHLLVAINDQGLVFKVDPESKKIEGTPVASVAAVDTFQPLVALRGLAPFPRSEARLPAERAGSKPVLGQPDEGELRKPSWELREASVDLEELTGWNPEDEFLIILASDITRTLTRRSDWPISGEILKNLLRFLEHPHHRLIMTSADADSHVKISQRPFFNGRSRWKPDQWPRYFLQSGAGKVRRSFDAEGSEKEVQILKDWPLEKRTAYAERFLRQFFRHLRLEVKKPQGIFRDFLKGVTVEEVEKARVHSLRRFKAIVEKGEWGLSVNGKYDFHILAGTSLERLGDPVIEDLGIYVGVELQDMVSRFNGRDTDQSDTLRWTRSIENAIRRRNRKIGWRDYLVSGRTFASAMKTTKARGVKSLLKKRLLPSLKGSKNGMPKKILFVSMGDSRLDAPTSRLKFGKNRSIYHLSFFLNDTREDAPLLGRKTYVTKEKEVDGALQVLEYLNQISGRKVSEASKFKFAVRQWSRRRSETRAVEEAAFQRTLEDVLSLDYQQPMAPELTGDLQRSFYGAHLAEVQSGRAEDLIRRQKEMPLHQQINNLQVPAAALARSKLIRMVSPKQRRDIFTHLMQSISSGERLIAGGYARPSTFGHSPLELIHEALQVHLLIHGLEADQDLGPVQESKPFWEAGTADEYRDLKLLAIRPNAHRDREEAGVYQLPYRPQILADRDNILDVWAMIHAGMLPLLQPDEEIAARIQEIEQIDVQESQSLSITGLSSPGKQTITEDDLPAMAFRLLRGQISLEEIQAMAVGARVLKGVVVPPTLKLYFRQSSKNPLIDPAATNDMGGVLDPKPLAVLEAAVLQEPLRQTGEEVKTPVFVTDENVFLDFEIEAGEGRERQVQKLERLLQLALQRRLLPLSRVYLVDEPGIKRYSELMGWNDASREALTRYLRFWIHATRLKAKRPALNPVPSERKEEIQTDFNLWKEKPGRIQQIRGRFGIRETDEATQKRLELLAAHPVLEQAFLPFLGLHLVKKEGWVIPDKVFTSMQTHPSKLLGIILSHKKDLQAAIDSFEKDSPLRLQFLWSLNAALFIAAEFHEKNTFRRSPDSKGPVEQAFLKSLEETFPFTDGTKPRFMNEWTQALLEREKTAPGQVKNLEDPVKIIFSIAQLFMRPLDQRVTEEMLARMEDYPKAVRLKELFQTEKMWGGIPRVRLVPEKFTEGVRAVAEFVRQEAALETQSKEEKQNQPPYFDALLALREALENGKWLEANQKLPALSGLGEWQEQVSGFVKKRIGEYLASRFQEASQKLEGPEPEIEAAKTIAGEIAQFQLDAETSARLEKLQKRIEGPGPSSQGGQEKPNVSSLARQVLSMKAGLPPLPGEVINLLNTLKKSGKPANKSQSRALREYLEASGGRLFSGQEDLRREKLLKEISDQIKRSEARAIDRLNINPTFGQAFGVLWDAFTAQGFRPRLEGLDENHFAMVVDDPTPEGKQQGRFLKVLFWADPGSHLDYFSEQYVMSLGLGDKNSGASNTSQPWTELKGLEDWNAYPWNEQAGFDIPSPDGKAWASQVPPEALRQRVEIEAELKSIAKNFLKRIRKQNWWNSWVHSAPPGPSGSIDPKGRRLRPDRAGARSEARTKPAKVSLSLSEALRAAGWDPEEEFVTVGVFDNTLTLTSQTEKPISGAVLEGSRAFLSHPDNRFVVNSGEALQMLKKSHAPFFEGPMRFNLDQLKRYYRIAGNGKTTESGFNDKGEPLFLEMAENWSMERRLRYAEAVIDVFYRELRKEVSNPQGSFVQLLEGVTPDQVEAAYQDAKSRFAEAKKTWGNTERYLFTIVEGALGERLAKPFIYDVGSALCLEFQGAKLKMQAFQPGQKDSDRFTRSIETEAESALHETLPDFYISSGSSFVYLSRSSKAISVKKLLEEIIQSIPAGKKILIVIVGDGRNDIPTFQIDLSRYPNVYVVSFYLNHSPDGAEALPPNAYITEQEQVAGAAQVIGFAVQISGKKVKDIPVLRVLKWGQKTVTVTRKRDRHSRSEAREIRVGTGQDFIKERKFSGVRMGMPRNGFKIRRSESRDTMASDLLTQAHSSTALSLGSLHAEILTVGLITFADWWMSDTRSEIRSSGIRARNFERVATETSSKIKNGEIANRISSLAILVRILRGALRGLRRALMRTFVSTTISFMDFLADAFDHPLDSAPGQGLSFPPPVDFGKKLFPSSSKSFRFELTNKLDLVAFAQLIHQFFNQSQIDIQLGHIANLLFAEHSRISSSRLQRFNSPFAFRSEARAEARMDPAFQGSFPEGKGKKSAAKNLPAGVQKIRARTSRNMKIARGWKKKINVRRSKNSWNSYPEEINRISALLEEVSPGGNYRRRFAAMKKKWDVLQARHPEYTEAENKFGYHYKQMEALRPQIMNTSRISKAGDLRKLFSGHYKQLRMWRNRWDALQNDILEMEEEISQLEFDLEELANWNSGDDDSADWWRNGGEPRSEARENSGVLAGRPSSTDRYRWIPKTSESNAPTVKSIEQYFNRKRRHKITQILVYLPDPRLSYPLLETKTLIPYLGSNFPNAQIQILCPLLRGVKFGERVKMIDQLPAEIAKGPEALTILAPEQWKELKALGLERSQVLGISTEDYYLFLNGTPWPARVRDREYAHQHHAAALRYLGFENISDEPQAILRRENLSDAVREVRERLLAGHPDLNDPNAVIFFLDMRFVDIYANNNYLVWEDWEKIVKNLLSRNFPFPVRVIINERERYHASVDRFHEAMERYDPYHRLIRIGHNDLIRLMAVGSLPNVIGVTEQVGFLHYLDAADIPTIVVGKTHEPSNVRRENRIDIPKQDSYDQDLTNAVDRLTARMSVQRTEHQPKSEVRSKLIALSTISASQGKAMSSEVPSDPFDLRTPPVVSPEPARSEVRPGVSAAPSIIYADGRRIAKRPELREETLAAAYLMKGQQKLVVFHAGVLSEKAYRDFSRFGVKLVAGNFEQAYRQYGRGFRGRQVRMVHSGKAVQIPAVDRFLWKQPVDILAAREFAISNGRARGVAQKSGIYAANEFLRRELRAARADLVVKIAA